MKHTILKILLACIFCLISGIKIQAETIGFKVREYASCQSFIYHTDTISATNSYGNSSNDVRYHFQINCPMVFLVHHVGSKLPGTVMYLLKKKIGSSDSEYQEIQVSKGRLQIPSESKLLDELRSTIFSRPTGLDSLQSGQAGICMLLEMGEYELVCEGKAAENTPCNGEIQTSFYFNQAGSWREYPIDLGVHNCNFTYRSSGHYCIEHTSKLAIYYKIQIEVPMIFHVETSGNKPITVCLFDEEGTNIDMPFQKDHYEKALKKGTYFVSVETHDENIWIDLRISLLPKQPGNCIATPFFIEQSKDTGVISYFNMPDTRQYTDNYQGEATNDVFFALLLTDSIFATVEIGARDFTNGLFMTLQNSKEQEEGCYFINNRKTIDLKLPPGVHYLICEGVKENGVFFISLKGKLPPREQKEKYIPSTDMNYIRTITSHGSYSVPDSSFFLSKAKHKICYYDCLGRPMQEICYKGSSGRQDQIVHHEYDDLGRDGKEWASIIRTEQSAGLYMSFENVKSLSQKQYADAAAFSIPVYDNSPLNRIKESYGPGQEWQNNRRGKKMNYSINTKDDNCRYFVVRGTLDTPLLQSGGDYPSGELEVMGIQDEDGCANYVFTDKLGHSILTRIIADGDTLDTYRVYDDYGNLSFVLPPAINSSLAKISQEMLDKYAYQYRYDYRNRCIGKKLPGCEVIETIYDYSNRPVFIQDGEQRKRGEWSFVLSDLSEHNVLVGIYRGTPNRSICEKTQIYVVFSPGGAETTYGYKMNLPDDISMRHMEILKVNYYDNYNYRAVGLGFDSSFDYVKDGAYGERYENEANKQHCKGLLTGSIVSVLGKSGKEELCSSYYYDYEHNLIQIRSHTLGKKQIVNKAKFNFLGKPISVCEEYDNSVKLARNYSYDHVGKLKAETHIINGVDTVRFRLSYDKLGRIERLSRYHGSDSLCTDLRYNIRSWITSIDSPVFSQTFNYTDGMGVPCYNGNISSTTWRTYSLTRGYCFMYDGLGRIKDALYGEGSNLVTNPNLFNEQVTAYDKLGNILGLKRYGQISENRFGLIDDLRMAYEGNLLRSVTDYAAGSTFGNASEFKDGANNTKEYEYDSKGNLTKDLNKKITAIQYNVLNLPSRVQFESGNSIFYLYDANGVKLRSTHVLGNDTTVTDYAGNVIYENGVPDKLLTGYGYISLSDNTYHHFIQDHQGNNRVIASSDGTVEEVNHHYPFGGLFAPAQGVQPYKYNGKELDRSNGLDWYDYGARMYDAALGRWHVVDPLSEKYNGVSPYAYCGNDPVNRIDPDGLDWYNNQVTGEYRWREGHGSLDGFTHLGTSVSIQMGQNLFLNAYQNGGVFSNRAVNAFDLISSSSRLQNRFLGKNSPLSDMSKSELFNALNAADLNALGRPIGEALVEFGAAQLGGTLLGKALNWGIGSLLGRNAGKGINQFTKSNLKLGREMHAAYKAGLADDVSTFKEFTKIKGIRPDFVDFSTKTIYELKPFNPRQIQLGTKQLNNYKLLFEQKYGGTWNTVLDFY